MTIDIEGEFEGEVKLDPIKFSKILKKKAIENNDTSCKILVPHDYIHKEIVVLLPKIKGKNK